jgi:hypothetical protein
MLHVMSVPNSMWSCAISTVVHLRNRTYSRAVGPYGGVPITLLTGAVPDASIFRVFGCIVFAKGPDNLRRKLELKAFRGVMVGYSLTLIIHRDTVFKIPLLGASQRLSMCSLRRHYRALAPLIMSIRRSMCVPTPMLSMSPLPVTHSLT